MSVLRDEEEEAWEAAATLKKKKRDENPPEVVTPIPVEPTPQPIIKPPPQISIPELKLIKPTAEIRPPTTTPIYTKTAPLKLEPPQLVKPRWVDIKMQITQPFTRIEEPLEVPKVQVIRPTLKTLPKILEEKPPIKVKVPAIELQTPTKAILPNITNITAHDLSRKTSLINQRVITTSREEVAVACEEEGLEPDSPEVFSVPEGLLDEESECKGGRLGKVSPEGFICVLADKSEEFNRLIEYLCSVVALVKGIEPDVVVTSAKKLRDYQTDKNFIILEGVDVWLGQDGKQEFKQEFENLLYKFYRESKFRFLVLRLERDKISWAKDELRRASESYRYDLPYLYSYVYKGFAEEDKERILSGLFGFVKPGAVTGLIGRQSSELANQYENKLNEIKDKLERELPLPHRPKRGENEGELHYRLKFLVIKHLRDNCNINVDQIKTEKMEDGIKPDVSTENGSKRYYIEIETLYGTRDPLSKLQEKLDRFLGQKCEGQKCEVWLVVPNTQALLYVDDLLKARKDYRSKEVNVEVYTTDLTGEGSRLIYGEEKEAGLIKLTDLLKWFKKHNLKRHPKFLE